MYLCRKSAQDVLKGDCLAARLLGGLVDCLQQLPDARFEALDVDLFGHFGVPINNRRV